MRIKKLLMCKERFIFTNVVKNVNSSKNSLLKSKGYLWTSATLFVNPLTHTHFIIGLTAFSGKWIGCSLRRSLGTYRISVKTSSSRATYIKFSSIFTFQIPSSLNFFTQRFFS